MPLRKPDHHAGRRRLRRRPRPQDLALGAAVALLLTACTPTPTPVPTPTPTGPVAEATPSAEPTPAGPALLPEGSAEDNLPYFSQIIRSVWNSDGRGAGRAYVDALVGGGFDKGAMQVTADTSTVGNPAESIQVSVRWGEQCLIGQVGEATGEPVTTVLGALPDGACLLGETRPIDW
ncbi:hypothetical protein FBY40_2245 [Microbacterium sp. SLBN-154]|uniref:DUF6993 domain-containing protein n=1 Tax=Microbacterium sp. SLBN-154 TaxID=2768458 RepID=UPI0011671E1A|nr:hypothetical protein [Microbacterium sp. SLBN-154]TQK19734.1 hypothetical protein FBY40_2245 [Microbacterium sp. SLBN-154]